MKRIAGIALGFVMFAGTAFAGPGDGCSVAAHLVQVDAPMPRVAAAIKAKSLTVAIAGTGSSILAGPNGATTAYPARFEDALHKKLPGVAIKMISLIKPRQTAADMAAAFPKILKDDKPQLVIWQTGTSDAMQGISAEEFQQTLDQTTNKLREAGVDVVLMNPQYNPRSDSVIQTAPYTDAIRWVATSNNVNLFDRQAVMRHWGELGTFDLLAATKSLDTAAQVHECIGRLLATLVVQAAATEEGQKEKAKQ